MQLPPESSSDDGAECRQKQPLRKVGHGIGLRSSRAASRGTRPQIAAKRLQESARGLAALPSESSDEHGQKPERRPSDSCAPASRRGSRPRIAVRVPQEFAAVLPSESGDEGDRGQKQCQGPGSSHDNHLRKRPRLAAHGPRESVGTTASHPTDDSEERDQSTVIAPAVARARPSPMSRLAALSQCKTSRSPRAAGVQKQPRLAMLPSESSESEHDVADVAASARRPNRRHGLASPTAHGPCSVEEVQGLFLWPRDAIRAATVAMKHPHDPYSFFNRPVEMATQFSGLGSAELAAAMLRSWSEVYRGTKLHLSMAYGCEKSPAMQKVLKKTVARHVHIQRHH